MSSDLIAAPSTDLPYYQASKKAIDQYATAHVQLHPELRILTLLPGPVDTPLFKITKKV